MRVLYLINSMDFGGAQSLLRNLIHYTKHNESDCQIELAILYQLGHFGEQILKLEIPVCLLEMSSKYDIRAVPRLVRLIKHGNYDIIHVHLFPSSYLAAFVSFLVKKPKWIFTEHNIFNRRRKYLPFKLIDAFIYSRFDKIIAVSSSVESALIKWLSKLNHKLIVIPNGVTIPSTAREKSVSDYQRPVRFLFAGRLEYAKGVDLLIEALSQLKHGNFELIIAGDGSQREALEQLVSRKGLSQTISFVGARSDLPDFMCWADCLVLPSRWEGLPMVILEAMSFGLPVIASAIGGAVEVIEDAISGWLIEPEDISALTVCLEQVLENPGWLSTIGDNARQRIIAAYSIPTIGQRHMTLYRDLITP